ncbi:MAG TPA: DUF6702 family protein [Flavobacteriaceae bacterium]|nr:DUF6702 family protein [Flavobacteriaceae bacterium]
MKYPYLIVFLFIPLVAFTSIHKYYVSLTQVDYNAKAKAIQITMNVFIDDFELTLNNTYGKQFNLATPEELQDSNHYFEDYLAKHFKVKLEGEKMNHSYIGREYKGDVAYIYLEIEHINHVKSIEIENTVLFEYFTDQKNLIKLKINDTFDSLLLTQDNAKGLLNFQ